MPAQGESLTHLKMPGWGDHRGMGLDLATRRRVTAVMVRKYAKATRGEVGDLGSSGRGTCPSNGTQSADGPLTAQSKVFGED